ncbi:MAG: tetratricopeptide repeat protein [Bullifex sp.]
MTKKKNIKKDPSYFAASAKEAYDCLLESLGPDHIMTFMIKGILADAYSDAMMYEELFSLTEGISDEALAKLDEISTDRCFDIAMLRMEACIETERWDEAIAEGTKTLPVLRKKFRDEKVRQAEFAVNLATAYREKSMFSEADKVLKKLISDLNDVLQSPSEPIYFTSVIDRAGVLNAMGKTMQARTMLKELIDMLDDEKQDEQEMLPDFGSYMSEDDMEGFITFLSAGLAGSVAEEALVRLGTGEPFTFRTIISELKDTGSMEDIFADLADELGASLTDDEGFFPYPDEDE